MTTSQKREFARMGAEFRLKTIQEEQQAIFRVFPELREGAAARLTSFARRRRRRRMSAAERKAVGARMRAYWAQAPRRDGRRTGRCGQGVQHLEAEEDVGRSAEGGRGSHAGVLGSEACREAGRRPEADGAESRAQEVDPLARTRHHHDGESAQMRFRRTLP
jgi:hypothetical protein